MKLQPQWLFIGRIVFILSLGYAAWLGATQPFRNWDMVAYVGSAAAWDAPDAKAAYDTTMADVQRVVWPAYFRDITRSILSGDAESFRQQLPFYQVKPLYVGLVWAVQKVTGGYAEATWYISAVSLVLLGLMLALMRPERMGQGAWLLVLAGFLWMGQLPLATLARLSTPDALAAALSMAAFYYVLKEKVVSHFIFFGVLAIAARPDTVLVLGMASVFLLAGRKLKLRETAISLGIFGLACALIQFLMGSYGWEKLFYYTFINKVARPEEVAAVLNAQTYLQVLYAGFSRLTYDARLFPMLAFTSFALVCHFLRPETARCWLWVLALAWASYALRFALYPAWWESRYYFVHHLLALLACANLMAPYFQAVGREFRQRRVVNSV